MEYTFDEVLDIVNILKEHFRRRRPQGVQVAFIVSIDAPEDITVTLYTYRKADHLVRLLLHPVVNNSDIIGELMTEAYTLIESFPALGA